jgi:hypothetical protein
MNDLKNLKERTNTGNYMYTNQNINNISQPNFLIEILTYENNFEYISRPIFRNDDRSGHFLILKLKDIDLFFKTDEPFQTDYFFINAEKQNTKLKCKAILKAHENILNIRVTFELLESSKDIELDIETAIYNLNRKKYYMFRNIKQTSRFSLMSIINIY